MTLRTQFGYPVCLAAGVVGFLRQTQRWLPRYEWVAAHQLAAYVAVLNLLVVLIGAVGVFAIGVRADRELAHRWRLSPAGSTALLGAVGGFGIGTALAFLLHPGHNTITTPLLSFVGPMAVYTVSYGLPIGFVALGGLTASRIHAIEATEDAVGTQAVTPDGEHVSEAESETNNTPQTSDATISEQ